MADARNYKVQAFNFQKLTPRIDGDGKKLGAYCEALDFAFSEDDLRNIAVSGGYGVGKTSTIKSYEQSHKKTFIYISLPSFTLTQSGLCEEDEKKCKEGKKDQESEANSVSADNSASRNNAPIEQKIIKQLLHQIQPDTIPLTQFKIKRKKSNWALLWLSIQIFFFCAFSLYLIWPKLIEERLEPLFSLTAGLPLAERLSNLPILGFTAEVQQMKKFSSNSTKIKISNDSLSEDAGLSEAISTLLPKNTNDTSINGHIKQLGDTRVKQPNFQEALVGTFGFLYLCLILWIIFKTLKHNSLLRALRKLTFLGAGVEIQESDGKGSYFDQHFSEIVYLFNECDADAIVFEDLDRFDTNYLFKRLREINTAVNNTRRFTTSKKKETQPLRFFYLLRDDIFTSNDRSKFFDFIIPIIPVADASNSYDQLLGILKTTRVKNSVGTDVSLADRINSGLLSYSSLFIADMRLLNNIINEFYVYAEKLAPEQSKGKDCSYDYSKQFAMIVYKNLFPKDFILLQQGKSFLNQVFSSEKVMVQKCTEKLSAQIAEVEEKIQKAQDEHLHNKQELLLLFITDWGYDGVQINGEQLSLRNSEEKYTAAKTLWDNPESITNASLHQNWQTSYAAAFKNSLTLLKKDKKFTARIEALENKEKIHSLHEELTLRKKELEEITLLPFNDLCKKYRAIDGDIFVRAESSDICAFKYISENKNSKNLIRYLLEEGYIGRRSYADYTAMFYEHSLTSADREFLRMLPTPQPLPFTHELENVREVVQKLTDADYKRPGILNITLLEYLLIHEQSKFFLLFFETLAAQKNFAFSRDFFLKTEQLPTFISGMLRAWSGYFKLDTVQNPFSNKEFSNFLCVTLEYCELETLIALSSKGKLHDFLRKEEGLFTFEFKSSTLITNKSCTPGKAGGLR